MKLETSQILTQLSEQDRNKVEAELADLNGRRHQLEAHYRSSVDRIEQLNQQRDQAMRNRNSASLLQVFDTAFREQQAYMTIIQAALATMEEEKQQILTRLADAHRMHHSYDKMHKNEKHRQDRKQELKSQRQMDDMIASRKSGATA